MHESGKGAFTQLAQKRMASAAFRMLGASINKMSAKDIEKVAVVINHIKIDRIIEDLTDDSITCADYAKQVGNFIEHANTASKHTA